MIRAGERFGASCVLFIGYVEDVDDPLMVGRVRVRCAGWHSPDANIMPTSGLPWAQVVQPVTSAARGDVGASPTGLAVGSQVAGFFADGERAQHPFVLGTIASIPQALAGHGTSTAARVDEPDVNRLARNDPALPHASLAADAARRRTGVTKAAGGTWDEPASAYAARYPNNSVGESASGHLREVDDTPGAERTKERHRSGTFHEVRPSGDRVVRVVGSSYELVANSSHVRVGGSANMRIEGDMGLSVGGALTIKAGGVVTIVGSRIELNP